MRGGGEAAVLSARPLSRPPPDPFPLVTRPNRLAHPSGPSLHPLSTPSFGCARYLCILRLQAKELKRSEDTLLKAHAELHAQVIRAPRGRKAPIKPLHHRKIRFPPQIFADTTCPCRALQGGTKILSSPPTLHDYPPLMYTSREAVRGE
eukprot:8937786-Pyramimonas_sp.AAC.1